MAADRINSATSAGSGAAAGRERMMEIARRLREADRAANLASTAELVADAPLDPRTRRVIVAFRARALVRRVPGLGEAAGALGRTLRRGGS